MKRKRKIKQWGLILFTAVYLGAVWWVFTKSSPLTAERDITIRIAHWQIELGPPDGIEGGD